MAARTISSSWKPASAFSRQRVDHRFLGPSGVTGFSSMPDNDEMSRNIEIVVRGDELDTRSGSVTARPWTAAARLHPGPEYLIACNHGSAVGARSFPTGYRAQRKRQRIGGLSMTWSILFLD
jgi:hypothetical protein